MKLRDFICQQPLRAPVLLAVLISAALLGFALVSQYGFGLFPCELCIAQRVPYALIILIGALSLLLVKTAKGMLRVAWICAGLFVIDGGIAFYHTGVEWGIFPGPSGCSNTPNPNATIEEMRAAIRNAALVSCDQAMVHILGLSMAAWNTLAAFGSALLTVYATHKAKARAV